MTSSLTSSCEVIVLHFHKCMCLYTIHFKILYFAHKPSQLQFLRRILKYSHSTFLTCRPLQKNSYAATDHLVQHLTAWSSTDAPEGTFAKELPLCDTLKHYCNNVHTMRYAHYLILSALSAALEKTKNIITSFPLLPKAYYNTINESAIIVK